MEEVFDIYYKDLTEDAKKRLLDALHIANEAEMNWDVFPVASIPIVTDEE